MKYLKLYEGFVNESFTKYIEMTGSPKEAGFKTKRDFLDQLEPFGFSHDKMRKKSNRVSILVTNDKYSETRKMVLAEELGVAIMTYAEMAENFNLETNY